VAQLDSRWTPLNARAVARRLFVSNIREKLCDGLHRDEEPIGMSRNVDEPVSLIELASFFIDCVHDDVPFHSQLRHPERRRFLQPTESPPLRQAQGKL
jgi:hypothetical protein